MAGGTWLGIALAVVSACAFGSGALFAKPVYAAGVGWHELMAWRFLLGAGLAWAWVLAVPSVRRGLRAMDRRSVAVSIALGVLYVGNSGTYFAGIETVPASLAALIVYLYPALVAVLSLRIGRRLEGRRAWAALVLSLVGVALAVGNIRADAVPPVSGLALILASPVIYAVWIVFAARLSGERRSGVGRETAASGGAVDPLAAGAIMLAATAVAYWLSALALERPVLPTDIPATAWPGIAGVGVVSTFVAVQAFYAGAHRIGAARASIVSTVEPVWTIALAGLLYGESLSPLQLVGGGLILAGVVLAQTGPGAGSGGTLRIADE